MIYNDNPTFDGEIFYPILSVDINLLFNKYKSDANKLEKIKFIGSLAEYKCHNMDVVVAKVLNEFK